MNIATVLADTPTLNWEGTNLIGLPAKITGSFSEGYELLYKEDGVWKYPQTLNEYKWIAEAFLKDLESSPLTLKGGR